MSKPNPVQEKKIEFEGKVFEIHSGDSISIQSLKTTSKIGRFFLAGIRAPKNTEDWGFEAKEQMRKSLIGKNVKISYLYDKTVQKKGDREQIPQFYGEQQSMKPQVLSFAKIWLDDVDVTLSLLKKGLAQVSKPRNQIEEELIGDITEYEQAESTARNAGLGQFSKKQYILPRYNDLTQGNIQKKAKDGYNFLKDYKTLTGIVESVLSGCKLKLRVNEVQSYVLMALKNIRTFQHDPNVPAHDVWATEVLRFAKERILQREITFSIENVDNRGLFYGEILFEKTPFSHLILSSGLAVCTGKATSEQSQAEKIAKDAKLGVWGENLDLSASLGYTPVQTIEWLKVPERHRIQMSEIVSLDNFYYQEDSSKELERIHRSLKHLNPDTLEGLKLPIKKGTPCIAIYDADGLFYRGIIEREITPNKFQVFFQDYGNMETVYLDSIRKIPESIKSIPPQARKARLAMIQGPTQKHPLFKEITQYFNSIVWNRDLNASILYRTNEEDNILIYQDDDTSNNKTVNQHLLGQGMAKIQKGITLPDIYKEWQTIQKQAASDQLKLWTMGDSEDEDN